MLFGATRILNPALASRQPHKPRPLILSESNWKAKYRKGATTMKACRILAESLSRPSRFVMAILMLPALSAIARGQATYSVGSMPVTAIVNAGQVELTGNVTFGQVVTGINSVLGTIVVTYPVPITVAMSETNGIPGSGVRIINNAGDYALAATNPPSTSDTVGILNVSSGAPVGQGQVVIQVPAGAGNGSFTLTGVRVAVAGTGQSTLIANISTANNAIIAGQTNAVVVSSIAPGVASIATDPIASIDATTGAVIASPEITVKEGFLNAWGDPSTDTEAGIRITLARLPPPGVSIVFPSTATTDGAWLSTFTTMAPTGSIIGTPVTISASSSSLNVHYRATFPTDPTKQETLTIAPTVQVNMSEISLPLPAFSMTYTVSLAPIGPAFAADNNFIADPLLIPRYARSDVGPAPLMIISGEVKKRRGQLTSS